jgi:hypothetical protein
MAGTKGSRPKAHFPLVKLPTEELYTIKTIREERKVLTFLEK